MSRKHSPLFLLFIAIAACSSGDSEKAVENRLIAYKVRSTFPHDQASFTQGFVVYQGKLYESTGENGQSWFGVLNIKTGKPERSVALDSEYFGEGITILNNKVYQLTWKSKKGFIYAVDDFEKLGEFTYSTQGWGLTNDGTHLIMSDGTDKIYYLDTTSFAVTKTISVTFDAKPVNMLNELEYVNGSIYVNIWQTNTIAKIDPGTGEIRGFLDLTALEAQAKIKNPNLDVLNGIAWYEPTQSLLVTGKYWPYIYALKLEEN